MSKTSIEHILPKDNLSDFDEIVANFAGDLQCSQSELVTVSVATITPAYETLNTSERLNLLLPSEALDSYTPLRNTGNKIAGNCLYELDDASYSPIGSFKYRGAWNAIASLPYQQLLKFGIVTASAGNHAQGVALAARHISELYKSRPYLNVGNKKVIADIYVPKTIAPCKLKAIKDVGGDYVNVIIKGETFDDAYEEALLAMTNKPDENFIHPFDQEQVIEGQSTEAKKLLEQLNSQGIPLNSVRIFITVGGGGLASGYVKEILKLPENNRPKLVGVQLEGADSAFKSYWNYRATGEIEAIPVNGKINKLADGAGVKCVGSKTLEYLVKLDDFIRVSDVHVGKQYAKDIDAICKVSDVFNKDIVDPFYGLPEPASMLSKVGCYEYANLLKNRSEDSVCPENEVWVYLNTGINYNPELVNDFISIYNNSLPKSIGHKILRMVNSK